MRKRERDKEKHEERTETKNNDDQLGSVKIKNYAIVIFRIEICCCKNRFKEKLEIQFRINNKLFFFLVNTA